MQRELLRLPDSDQKERSNVHNARDNDDFISSESRSQLLLMRCKSGKSSGLRCIRKMMMESSEEEEDFPCIESVTPQSKIDSIYQSNTEKGIRKICFELLDLKDTVENLCGNT